MSQYTKSTNFATKDNLTPGDPLKVVRGTEIDTEFNNISTAIATKTDNASAAITGGSITGITDLAVADGGTGASTAAGALNNLLPSQVSAANKYLQSDGTNASWDAVSLSTADITGTLPVANGGTGVTSSTGTGDVVLSNSPTLVTPILGTPTSATLTNATGLPISTGVSGLGTGVATLLATPSSANLASAITDETGSGSLVFATSPTLVTPVLGTPTSATLTNATGLPISTGVSGLGTGVATFLATPSSANLAAALTDETGTGANVFATSPTLVTPALGTPSALVGTNITGTAANFNINGTVGATTANTGAFTTLAASSTVTLSGGTANGVLYLNGSKVATSGSALVFDGTKLGVGTGSPTEVLTLNASTNGTTAIRLQNQGTNIGFISNEASLVGGTSNNFSVCALGSLSLIFGASGAEQMRLTSTGLGIGTTSPAQKLHVSVGRIAVSNGYNIGSTDGNTGMFVGTNSVSFQTNANTVATFDSAGGFKTLNTIGVGNTAPSTSGAGITFPATQSASTDANTLDDYEEGTWTPTDGSGAGLTITNNESKYTKIGRVFTVQTYFAYPSTANGSNASIGGLPFTSSPSSFALGAISSSATVPAAVARANSTSFSFIKPTGANVINSELSAITLGTTITCQL